MNDNEIEHIIENEKEWRRHLLKDLRSIRQEQMRVKEDVAKLKVWAWISRSIVISSILGMFAWVKTKLGGI